MQRIRSRLADFTPSGLSATSPQQRGGNSGRVEACLISGKRGGVQSALTFVLAWLGTVAHIPPNMPRELAGNRHAKIHSSFSPICFYPATT